MITDLLINLRTISERADIDCKNGHLPSQPLPVTLGLNPAPQLA